jgi:hypothetical protein
MMFQLQATQKRRTSFKSVVATLESQNADPLHSALSSIRHGAAFANIQAFYHARYQWLLFATGS